MNEEQKKILLKTAKDSVTAAVNKLPAPSVSSDDEQLNAHCGCFVTLKNNEMLRGCIGQFTSDKPLIQLISDMGVSSSTGDPRFMSNPIMPDELSELDVEISVLSELKRTDDPLSLRLGIDGIYIKQGYSSGCFLPQVATETGWNKEEFLSYCCGHKAGLKEDAWKDPKTEVYLFTADIFGADLEDI